MIAVRFTSERNVSLDVLRIGAAMLVLFEHVRASVFVPYEALEQGHLWLAPFYALTSMGKEAVMIFFALSGYLIGGHVISRMQEDRWSALDYVIRRMTRLWIVILPALAATYLIDHLAMSFGNGDLYDGSYAGGIVPSLPTPLEPANYSWPTLFGNILFLQTIYVPVYGSNGPLWSIAYEFWYYVMFPLLAWLLLVSGRTQHRIIAGVAVASLALWLPWDILRLGLVWFAGVLSFLLGRALNRTAIIWPKNIGWLGFVVIITVALSSAITGKIDSFFVGLIVAVCIPLVSRTTWKSSAVRSSAGFGAEMSYSLYLLHFPIVIALAGLLNLRTRLLPSPTAFLEFAGICMVAFLAGFIFWYAFERRTQALYQFLCKFLRTGARK